ncbi:MAG: hypothetical protein RLZZ628_387 [Bacteroidota bacterium]|jgi:hypothetical protein
MNTEKVVLKIPAKSKQGLFAFDGTIESKAPHIIGIIVESEVFLENNFKTLAPEQIKGARLKLSENAQFVKYDIPLRLLGVDLPRNMLFFPILLNQFSTQKSFVELAKEVEEDTVVVFTLFVKNKN